MFVFYGGQGAVEEAAEPAAAVPPRRPLKLIEGPLLELGELRGLRGGPAVTEKPGCRRREAVVCRLLSKLCTFLGRCQCSCGSCSRCRTFSLPSSQWLELERKRPAAAAAVALPKAAATLKCFFLCHSNHLVVVVAGRCWRRRRRRRR